MKKILLIITLFLNLLPVLKNTLSAQDQFGDEEPELSMDIRFQKTKLGTSMDGSVEITESCTIMTDNKTGDEWSRHCSYSASPVEGLPEPPADGTPIDYSNQTGMDGDGANYPNNVNISPNSGIYGLVPLYYIGVADPNNNFAGQGRYSIGVKPDHQSDLHIELNALVQLPVNYSSWSNPWYQYVCSVHTMNGDVLGDFGLHGILTPSPNDPKHAILSISTSILSPAGMFDYFRGKTFKIYINFTMTNGVGGEGTGGTYSFNAQIPY